MAKFYGKIGFEVTSETAPGVWTPTIVEKEYFGDMTRLIRRVESSGQVNDNLVINNEFSIIADGFASENFYAMRYVDFMGSKWKITSVEVQYPRIIFYAGGVYSG